MLRKRLSRQNKVVVVRLIVRKVLDYLYKYRYVRHWRYEGELQEVLTTDEIYRHFCISRGPPSFLD